ncbi:FhaA domain-containing protein [Limnochorda pilosa]|uniref:FHA domain-containing protein n=1 Tax=Limnochorda pilosa TaxID=1555112 RepID=A0A0K2SJZ7_LIMPI|nr:DUF3662 and FHA domain-containing protein [Limnochorda pilosa]BAS27441.1 hypothetical protein LIP_1595 [Limnochorda pilosa]
MNWADRLEAWLGRAWDGRLQRRRGGLQPVLVARALEAEMLANKRVSILHTYVPNRYQVFLHPDDWAALRPIRRTLTVEMAEYLRDVADREHCAFVSPPRVEWVEASEGRKGQVRVEASFLEPEAAPEPAPPLDGPPEEPGEEPGDEVPNALFEGAPAGEVEPRGEEGAGLAEADEPPPMEGTRRFRATPEPSAGPRGRLVVVAGADRGTAFPLRRSEVVVGRASGEEPADVVLNDRAVSRRHARLVWRGGLWWLEDLGSTNGTYVNGDLIDSGWLQPGDRVEVGGSELLLEDEEPPRS